MSAESKLPPYARIKAELKNALARGDYAPGAQLPSESALVAEFGVSRMTVGRALNELATEGLIERVQGVGSFASALDRVSSTLTLRDLHEEIAARGHTHTAEVKLLKAETPKPALAKLFGVEPRRELFHSVILHLESGRAIQLEDRWVNPDEAPDYLAQDFTRVTPTHYLFGATALWRARYAIEAVQPSALEARWLGIEVRSPCLRITRETFSRSAMITRARLLHPGDRYAIEGEFSP
ncbi:MAG: UTRA domain-containing protein [Lysobacterales bacterium]